MCVSENALWRIVPLSLDYLPEILEIEKASYSDPWTEGMFRQEARNARSYFYLAFLGERLVGYAGFWLMVDEVHITKVTVVPARRRRGLGRRLVRYLFRKGRLLGAETARLEVRERNTAARRLYEKMGFQQVGLRKGYYARTKETAVIMERPLWQDAKRKQSKAKRPLRHNRV